MKPCPFTSSVDRETLFQRWDLFHHGVRGEVEALGTAGLEQAAREAWRNSSRCTGRLNWKSLHVIDARSVVSCDEIFEAVCSHMQAANNNGCIRPVMTIFSPWSGPENEVRIWNHQFIRYAGYRHDDGTVLGDPMNVEITCVAIQLGWKPPIKRGRFDLLPLIIQHGSKLGLFHLPHELIMEVMIRHPRHDWFEKLGLRWYAVPVVSDMIFATSRQAFPCAPFNGWYMSAEIGARNLGDVSRYNQLPVVAESLGLDTRQTRNLWRDHALLVLNEAVLHSFESDGFRIVDHHQAASEFDQFCQIEGRNGREVSADWSWIVPPVSGSSTPVFHRAYSLHPSLPNFFHQVPAWDSARGADLLHRQHH